MQCHSWLINIDKMIYPDLMTVEQASIYYRQESGLSKNPYSEKSRKTGIYQKLKDRKLRGFLCNGRIYVRASDIDIYLRETPGAGVSKITKKSPYNVPRPATCLNVSIEERVRAKIEESVVDGKTLSWVVNEILKEHFNLT